MIAMIIDREEAARIVMERTGAETFLAVTLERFFYYYCWFLKGKGRWAV